MTNSINRYLYLVLIFLIVFCSVFTAGQSINIANAEESYSFDNTGVLDDLTSSTINGQAFNINDYPADSNGSIKIITFVEYCYSDIVNKRDNYGLYIYIYNPQRLNISKTSKQNKITMAVRYDVDDKPESGGYEKFTLSCLSVSSGSYDKLFYKFKVIDHLVDGKYFYERVNSNSRRYDISEIELLDGNNNNAIAYGVGGKYIFTGFAEGYGSYNQTLNCVVEDLETCSLEVHHTYFRTNTSSLGANHYNQLSTVYFAIDNHYLEDYGYIQKIRAMWYEYKTKMALVTSNQTLYNKLYPNIGYELQNNPDMPSRTLDGNIHYFLVADYHNGPYFDYPGAIDYYWKYNSAEYVSYIESNIIPMVFYSERATANSQGPVFDALNRILIKQTNAGSVESSVLADYIYNYSNNLGHGYLEDRNISVDLFESNLDSIRESNGLQRGYNDVTIDLDEDRINMLSYDSNHSAWDKFWEYGFYSPQTDGDYIDKDPIYILKDSDFEVPSEISTDTFQSEVYMSVYGYDNIDAYISENLMVNAFDVGKLRDFYNNAKVKNQSVVLFRFAVSDYYCSEVQNGWGPYVYENNHDAYVCQETVFLDFDIIELTFNKDGYYTIIPVVSSPIDAISGITPPSSRIIGGVEEIKIYEVWQKIKDWWEQAKSIISYIVFAIILLLAVILIIKIIMAIVKAVNKHKDKLDKPIKKKRSYQLKSNKDLKRVKKNE